jgi:hypothetical protein
MFAKMRSLLLKLCLWLLTILLIHNLLSNTTFLKALHVTSTQNSSLQRYSSPTYLNNNNFSLTHENSSKHITKINQTKVYSPQSLRVTVAPHTPNPSEIHSGIIQPNPQFSTKFPVLKSYNPGTNNPKNHIFKSTGSNHKIVHKCLYTTMPHKEIPLLHLSTTLAHSKAQKVFSFSFSHNGRYKKHILKNCGEKKALATTSQAMKINLSHKSLSLTAKPTHKPSNLSCLTLSFTMNSYYDPPPGFSGRSSHNLPPRIASLPNKIQDLSKLDASLILRANYKTRTHLLRVSNCPMKAKDIHRLWSYMNKDLGYKIGPLPFEPDAPLSDNAYDWAHPESTTKRPLLISDAIVENPMLFHSTVMTASGRTHPGWETDSATSASFPMYAEHRINLSAFTTNPKTKRLESQTRLVQIQATMIPPNGEQFWTPLLVLSGLGTNYSNSKCCITGAVLAHLYAFLSGVDEDFGQRFTRSVQIDWSFFQFTAAGGSQRTQPVAVLKVCKNDPDDQSEAATQFSKKIGNLILGHIFESSPAAYTSFDFCGFNIRVHRTDRSGMLQPLGDTLRRDLTLPAPSDNLFKITLQNLSPYPSLPLIYQRLKETGILDIQNIAYVQVETHRGPRPSRLDWMNPFQVAVFLQSAGSAHALLHPFNQSHISQCLAPVLEDQMVPLILIPPTNLPLVSPSEHPPPLRFPTSSATQQLLHRMYQNLTLTTVQHHYLHPPPVPIPQTNTPSNDSPSSSSRNQSPKRSRNPGRNGGRDDPSPPPLTPTDADIKTFAEITERLQYLYARFPSDTYNFVSETLDSLRDQLSQDGLLEDEALTGSSSEAPFSLSSSSSNYHPGSIRPGQPSISSSASELHLGFSPTQSATPQR